MSYPAVSCFGFLCSYHSPLPLIGLCQSATDCYDPVHPLTIHKRSQHFRWPFDPYQCQTHNKTQMNPYNIKQPYFRGCGVYRFNPMNPSPKMLTRKFFGNVKHVRKSHLAPTKYKKPLVYAQTDFCFYVVRSWWKVLTWRSEKSVVLKCYVYFLTHYAHCVSTPLAHIHAKMNGQPKNIMPPTRTGAAGISRKQTALNRGLTNRIKPNPWPWPSIPCKPWSRPT